jgi:hypothetical protein
MLGLVVCSLRIVPLCQKLLFVPEMMRCFGQHQVQRTRDRRLVFYFDNRPVQIIHARDELPVLVVHLGNAYTQEIAPRNFPFLILQDPSSGSARHGSKREIRIVPGLSPKPLT